MKPRILIILNRFVIGGPAFHVANLVNGLQGDFDFLVVGGKAAKGEAVNKSDFNCRVKFIKDMGREIDVLGDLKSFYELKKIIKDFNPQIIHTHTSKPGFFVRYFKLNHPDIKLVHTYHGFVFNGYFNKLFSHILVNLERRMAKNTDIMIALSKLQKQELLSLGIGHDDNLKTIPLGINQNFFRFDLAAREGFRKRFMVDDETVAIGIIGRLAQIKNIQLFIRGIWFLKSEGLKIRGFIIGDGPEKQELKTLASVLELSLDECKKLNEAKDLVFTSWCENLPVAYSGLDLICLTSYSEGTPMSLIEAQMVGKPILTAKVGGIMDITEEDRTAVYFNDADDFLRKLKQLVKDFELRNKLTLNSRQFAIENFGLEKMIDSTRKTYFDLINKS